MVAVATRPMRSVTMASAASAAVGSSLTVRESLDRARSPRASCAAARHADRVLEEDAVELRRLGDLRDVGVALEVHVVGRDGVGMPPPGEMVARDAEEAAETEHALVGMACSSLERGSPAPLME